MRIFLAVILLVGLSGISGAYGEEVKIGGITFSLGFESLPGKHYYRLDCLRYENGQRSASKKNQKEDKMNSSGLSFRVTKMTPIGFEKLVAGIEIGMILPLSGYEKSWNLPALTPDFSGEVHIPGFC